MPRNFTILFCLQFYLAGQTPAVTSISYLGGDIQAVATDATGNVYVTGTTTGSIPLVNALQTKPGGGNCSPEPTKTFSQCPNIFAAKFDPTGTNLIYSTYLPGNQSDSAAGIAVDPAGNVYIAGTTVPAVFTTSRGVGNAFVKKLSPDGSALLYTTYIGGATEAFGVAVDANGNVAIAGLNVGGFPAVNPLPVQPAVKSLYVTNDGGQTWRTLNNGMNATNINSLAIDPTNRSTLYVATSSGFYKSTNAGVSWTRMMPDVPVGYFVILDSRHPTTLYAEDTSLARSTDAGNTWTVLDGNLPPSSYPPFTPRALTIDPTNSAVLWAATGGLIIKSLDSGDHWQTVYTFPSFVLAGPTLLGMKLLIDPQNSSRIYACCIDELTSGRGGVFRTDDGGKTWTQGAMGPLGGNAGILSPWLDPQNSTTLWGDWYYGLERSTDAGMSWTAVSLPPGLTTNQYEPGGLALDAAGIIYLLNDNGFMLRSADHGATWTTITGPWSPLATILAIDPTDSSTIYVASGASLMASGVPPQHAFVARLDPTGAIQWATLLGGSGGDEARAVAFDASGNVYVTGQTYSADFPTVNAFQPRMGTNAKNETANAFIAKISADGASLLYSSFLGGSGTDAGNAIAVDGKGNAYVAGGTSYDTKFPLVNPLRPSLASQGAASFLAKVDPTGGMLLFSTLLTGSAGYPAQDQVTTIALDPQGRVFVGGITGDVTMPLVNPIQSTFAIRANFIVRMPVSGTSPDFSTYLGDLESDLAGMVVAPNGSLWIAAPRLARIDFQPPAAQPGVPLILSVNNGASFIPGDVVAPGEIVTLMGEEFALAAQAAGPGALPSSMQGVSVSIGGITAPLFYVSPAQINFQVPFETPLSVAPLIVQRGAESSVARNVNVTAADPGIFSTSNGTSAVVHASDFSLVTEQSPARVGEYLAVFCTGFGVTDPPAVTGRPAATATPIKTYVVAQIDTGPEITVSYAGLAPGLTGVYQVNFQLPPGEVRGSRLLLLSVGASLSNYATLWVGVR